LIPEGKITTYKIIANYLNKPGACQAVGNSLRNNPFAPTVPCHRVLPSSYKIGGFFGETSENSKEVQKKIALLKKEGI
jgi:methylated-DNA-[protein]-cysteine S-methyltransferase